MSATQNGSAKVDLYSDELFSVRGKVACVTGASSGIGRAVATGLIEAGAKVVGLARRQDLLDEWQSEAGDNAAAFACNLSSDMDFSNLEAQISAPFGSPDIIINAAGVNFRQTSDEVTKDGWAKTIDLNLSVPFFLAQALVPAMKQKGWGRIINIASLQTERAFPGGTAYGASKAGIAQLTRSMAESWSADGICTNAIGPGFFPTELTQAVFDDADRAARNAQQTCIGRNGKLQDLIGPILFLSSDASSYVTGQLLYIDGGFTAK